MNINCSVCIRYFKEDSDLVVGETVELAVEVELGSLRICFLSNDIIELRVNKVHMIMLAHVPLKVLFICPIPIIKLQWNKSLEWMLFHVIVVPVFGLVGSCFREDLIDPVEACTHKRYAIRNVVVEHLLVFKFDLIRFDLINFQP